MMKSKKAAIEPFPLLVGVMGAVILLTIVSILLADYAYLKKVNPEPLGGKAVEVLEAYQEGDEALLFLDSAVKSSMKQAIHYAGEHGFKVVSPDFRYVYWTKGKGYWEEEKMSCWPEETLVNYIPNEDSLRTAFDYYFKNFGLNRHVNSFNGLGGIQLISPDKYQLELSRMHSPAHNPAGGVPPERLKLVGIAAEPLVVDRGKFEYNVTPSFTQTINVDLFSDFYKATSRALIIANTDTEELMEKYNDKGAVERLLPAGLEGHLLWSVDDHGPDPSVGSVCYTEPCTYNVKRNCREECRVDIFGIDLGCREVCDCVELNGGTRYYYWTTDTSNISANITTPEVYFWDYSLLPNDPPEKEEYSYKFALNWMTGYGNYCVPVSQC